MSNKLDLVDLQEKIEQIDIADLPEIYFLPINEMSEFKSKIREMIEEDELIVERFNIYEDHIEGLKSMLDARDIKILKLKKNPHQYRYKLKQLSQQAIQQLKWFI